MTNHADTLLDRIRLKQQATRWRTAAIFAVIALIVAIIYREDAITSFNQPHIARVTIEGVITDDLKRDALFEDLAKDDAVRAVILRLDTPGGTAVGGEQLYTSIRRLAEVKPVVATMRTMATSAGYMAALGADHIFAQEGSITGSIGVILQSANVTELLRDNGIDPVIIKSGDNKGIPSPFEGMSVKQRAVVQEVIDDFHRHFIALVAERRQLDAPQVRELADGRIFSGVQARDAHLIDALGGEREARAWLEANHNINANVNIVTREPDQEEAEWWHALQQFFGGKPLQFTALGLDGLMLIWHPQLTF